MTWTKQLANEDLAHDAPPAPRAAGTSADTQQAASDMELDVLGESRTDPASLLRPNPTFPGDEAD